MLTDEITGQHHKTEKHVPSDLQPWSRSRLVTYGDRSFNVAEPKLWNNLPLQIKKSSSIQSFKKELKSHLFKNFVSFGLKWFLMENDILLLFSSISLILWSAMSVWYERYISCIIIIIKWCKEWIIYWTADMKYRGLKLRKRPKVPLKSVRVNCRTYTISQFWVEANHSVAV